MILKHRDTPLARFEWTSSEEVRVDFVDEHSMHLLPLAFGLNGRGERGEHVEKFPGCEKRTIERRVRMLRDGEFLRRVGSDKSGSWEVLI